MLRLCLVEYANMIDKFQTELIAAKDDSLQVRHPLPFLSISF